MTDLQKKLCLLLGFCSSAFAAENTYDLKNLWTQQNREQRIILQDFMQKLIDKTLKAEFEKFDDNRNETTKNPVLIHYDQTLDRLLKQIPETKPVPGTVVIWYLYNLGFIIKTPTTCFGVDIHHRRAELLEPYLDFLVVTHNHNDHYFMPLLRAMTATKKLVISNFFPNAGYTKAAEQTHQINGITIHCGEADHNSVLKKFTMPMEIICPTGDKKFVFFTSGDVCHHQFLNKKSESIDLSAVHPSCGMEAIEAAKRINAKLTFIAHLHEMGHEWNKWRWTFEDGRRQLNIFREQNKDAYLPVWGEKFIWDGSEILTNQK